MSYSFNNPCGGCTKHEKCTDRHVIYGAVCGIHSMAYGGVGHLGAGSITLDCFNLDKEVSKD